MTKSLKIALFSLTLLFFSSCITSKEDYIETLQDFVENVEDNYERYDQAKWEKVSARFNELNKKEYKRFEEELTAKDKIIVAKEIAKFKSLQLKAGLEKFNDELKEISEQTKELFD